MNQICSCSGRNPNCVRCEGRGYYHPNDLPSGRFVSPIIPLSKDDLPPAIVLSPNVSNSLLKKWRRGAENGQAKAQLNLGRCYAAGIKLKKDEGNALKYYRQAAKQGNAAAQFNLGIFYATGLVIEKDEVEACAYFSLADENGCKSAQEARSILKKRLTHMQILECQTRIIQIKSRIITSCDLELKQKHSD